MIKKADNTIRSLIKKPNEYARSLSSRLKQGKEAAEMMTESFIEERYSRHEIQGKRARLVKSTWESIRQVLKSRRRLRE